MHNDSDTARYALAFLESLRTGKPGGAVAEELSDFVITNPESAWSIAVAAVMHAKSDFELQCVGAFILEDLLSTHPDQFVDRIVSEINSNDAFLRAAASMHMTGQPDYIWQRVNAALRGRGIPEDSLVNWSTITLPRDDGDRES